MSTISRMSAEFYKNIVMKCSELWYVSSSSEHMDVNAGIVKFGVEKI